MRRALASLLGLAAFVIVISACSDQQYACGPNDHVPYDYVEVGPQRDADWPNGDTPVPCDAICPPPPNGQPITSCDVYNSVVSCRATAMVCPM